MKKTAKKYLKVTDETQPEEALYLPEGSLGLPMFGDEEGGLHMELDFNPESVIECISLVIEKGEEKTFYSQAGIIEYAGNNLGWGNNSGKYKLL